ncbi:MAG TPA: TIGR03619 family F420-dependent LLM class oxidoreductase [Acidimicrobiales bacterium]|nr:TIGR03619 family F420-dependent LLM class oxidoreductase [Acidimicrobiales bacterium]
MPSFGYVIPSFGPFVDPAAFTDLVQAGEDLGFADVWFGDHVVVPHYAAGLIHPDWVDPLAACLAGMGKGSRLRFGTDVLVGPYRHPALVAKMVASGIRLTGGRMVLGVGVGYLRGEFDILGADHRNRGAVTDEFLDVLRALWAGSGTVGYHGDHVTFDDAVFGPTPSEPVPVWVGGNNPRARRRAATRGDGWHPLFPTPEGYAEGRRDILAHREEAGHHDDGPDGRPFTFSYSCAVTAVLDALPADYRMGTWDEVPDIPADFSYSPPVPAAPDGRPRFVGTPDLVAADVAAYVAAGVDHFTLRFANGSPDVGVADLLSQMGRFADEVAPRFDG